MLNYQRVNRDKKATSVPVFFFSTSSLGHWDGEATSEISEMDMEADSKTIHSETM